MACPPARSHRQCGTPSPHPLERGRKIGLCRRSSRNVSDHTCDMAAYSRPIRDDQHASSIQRMQDNLTHWTYPSWGVLGSMTLVVCSERPCRGRSRPNGLDLTNGLVCQGQNVGQRRRTSAIMRLCARAQPKAVRPVRMVNSVDPWLAIHAHIGNMVAKVRSWCLAFMASATGDAECGNWP